MLMVPHPIKCHLCMQIEIYTHAHTHTLIFRDDPSEVGALGENTNMGPYSIPQTLILHICSIEI